MEKPQRSKIHMAVATVFCLAATAFAAELPVRVMTIDKQPPERPYAKLVADFNSDGLPDIAIGGANGPLVWYAYPTWTKRLIAEGGYETVEGEPASHGRNRLVRESRASKSIRCPAVDCSSSRKAAYT
ncbi:MAG: FG-GAP repeat protein [Planctomycetota bacterium]|jgi:hypothetical protein